MKYLGKNSISKFPLITNIDRLIHLPFYKTNKYKNKTFSRPLTWFNMIA